MLLLHLLQELEALHPRHDHVGDHEVVLVARERLDRLDAVPGQPGRVAPSSQSVPDELAHEGVSNGEARRQLTPEDLRPHLLKEQVGGLLYADMEEAPLEKRLTALLREAKTAEEEGGS